MPGANPCAVTNALANNYTNAVRTVNRKFNALQRLAELLEQLGDVGGALPNISSLFPAYLINLDAYTSLVQACPFLNLPKSPSDADLARLQEQVVTAYADLIKRLNLHPYIRLQHLQSQMDKVASDVNEVLNTGQEFVQCLQQACLSTVGVIDFVNNFETEFAKFKRTYLAANGQVLTQTMLGKVNVVRGLIDNLNELMRTTPLITPSVSPVIPQVPIPTAHPVPPPPTGPVI